MRPEPFRRAAVRLGAVWAALILLFLHDWSQMAAQWWDSSTYNHIVLVPAIVAWLIHQRWLQLAQLRSVVWWPGLVAIGLALLIWTMGAVSGLNLLRQVGAVALLPAFASLLLGPRLTAALGFPLAYMAFLVPFGDELVPPLQMITAWLTIQLTHLSGVPAVVDGVFIDTPVGLFEVAEACSGVKFLIAMIALGVLVANVCFVSWRRRIAFMALAVIAPIVANGIRAWGTIYVAQSVGVEKAGGFDHIVYGWIFFALVIGAVLALSWRWFDRPIDAPLVELAAIESSPLLGRLERHAIRVLPALVSAAWLVMGAQVWAGEAARLHAKLPAKIDLPQVAGWHRVDYRPGVWWEPRATGAEHRLLGRYRNAAGQDVDVFVALYSAQREGQEAGGFGEGALRPETDWDWQRPGAAVPNAKVDILLARGKLGRLAETYYRSGGVLTGSNTRLKLTNIGDRLLLRARPTMLLILSAEDSGKGKPAEALAAFRKAAGPLDQWMDRTAGLR
jgi:exosortase A